MLLSALQARTFKAFAQGVSEKRIWPDAPNIVHQFSKLALSNAPKVPLFPDNIPETTQIRVSKLHKFQLIDFPILWKMWSALLQKRAWGFTPELCKSQEILRKQETFTEVVLCKFIPLSH